MIQLADAFIADLYRLHELALVVTGRILPYMDLGVQRVQQKADLSALRHSLNHAMHECLVVLQDQRQPMPPHLHGLASGER